MSILPKKKRKAASNGKPFEQRVARLMREIYDPPELVAAIGLAKGKDHANLLKKSSVRRGDQGRGAMEPDIVTPSNWWFELQWAGRDHYRPMEKLKQAIRDVDDTNGQWFRPVAVCQLKGSPTITAYMRMREFFDLLFNVPWQMELIPTFIKKKDLYEQVMSFDISTLITLLTAERDREKAGV